ncbi:FecR family protein [Piscinibacter sakaiensis]|uniref:FecR family protein n=1 Tax=Piscinibacter sakaiensis TaxID=1547922 RepID=UPI003AAD318A
MEEAAQAMTIAPPPQGPVEGPVDIPREIMAEAAVWVARLHGPSRSRRMELDCLAWQATSPAHSQAFEVCTDSWEMVGGITVRDVYAAASAKQKLQHRRMRRSRLTGWWAAGLTTACLLGGGVLGVLHWLDRGVYDTEVGEQRSIVLEDGTRVSLNTSTRVRVDIQPGSRRVEVEAGEALFEVARDPTRTFVVHAAGSDVVALGTSFVVRLAGGTRPDSVAVTLLSGRVSVQPAKDSPVQFEAVAMAPGDRVRISQTSTPKSGSAPKVDRPPVDQATAWKRSEIVFEGATLDEAVREMNRYNRSSIVLLGGPAVEGRRVSGTFKTTDMRGFAYSVAELHGLMLKQRKGGWELGPAR